MRIRRRMEWRWVLVGLAGLLVPALIFGGWWWLQRPISLPRGIAKQPPFTVLLPSEKYKIDADGTTYSEDTKVLTVKLLSDKTAVTITEQATPSVIASFPEMLSRQFDLMKKKQTIASTPGTAYVAENQDMHNQQVATINAHGTLLFARPDQPLGEDEWRAFFNSLIIVKK